MQPISQCKELVTLGAALSVCVVIFILLMLYLYSRIGNLDDLGAM